MNQILAVFGSMNIENKTVLVTGSTDGVGRLVARRLADQGARVLIHGRDRTRGEQLLKEIRAAHRGSAAFLPADFSSLTDNRDYAHYLVGPFFGTQYFKWLNLNGEIDLGTVTNFVPSAGPPVLANFTAIILRGVVRPVKGLTIENTYLLTRLLDRQTDLNIFNNHIIRSKWNYQFTKEFSLRIIGQYVTILSNPALTTLPSAKKFNGDVLFSYLLHPGTAVYIGYNSDLQNLDPTLGLDPNGNLLRTRSRFLNDGRQIFIKVSYLLRY